jgi:hypothetical protein
VLPPLSEPDLFVAVVREGCTYKYWVSAWDSWDNESAWSQSITAGVPTEVEPKSTDALDIRMLARELPDFSMLPPGIFSDAAVSRDALKKPGQPMRSYDDNPAVDTGIVKAADKAEIAIGHFISGALIPHIILADYDNLPRKNISIVFGGSRRGCAARRHARLKMAGLQRRGPWGLYDLPAPLHARFPLRKCSKCPATS